LLIQSHLQLDGIFKSFCMSLWVCVCGCVLHTGGVSKLHRVEHATAYTFIIHHLVASTNCCCIVYSIKLNTIYNNQMQIVAQLNRTCHQMWQIHFNTLSNVLIEANCLLHTFFEISTNLMTQNGQLVKLARETHSLSCDM